MSGASLLGQVDLHSPLHVSETAVSSGHTSRFVNQRYRPTVTECSHCLGVKLVTDAGKHTLLGAPSK